MTDTEDMKRAAAEAAVAELRDKLQPDTVLGVGTGSTVAHFITALRPLKGLLDKVVASSDATAGALRRNGLPVAPLNDVHGIDFYVDGTDAVNRRLELLKGGGGALTREKVLATAARQFLCIAGEDKWTRNLCADGTVVVEVLAMARSYVARRIAGAGGQPRYREGFVTDSGHQLLDVTQLPMTTPLSAEQELNGIPGVVANGIFAARRADLLLLADAAGKVRRLTPED